MTSALYAIALLTGLSPLAYLNALALDVPKTLAASSMLKLYLAAHALNSSAVICSLPQVVALICIGCSVYPLTSADQVLYECM